MAVPETFFTCLANFFLNKINVSRETFILLIFAAFEDAVIEGVDDDHQ